MRAERRPGGGTRAGRRPGAGEAPEPPVEEVEVTDLLLVMDLRDEVLVVDEHPRYHLAGCPYLAGRETFPLPIDEARADGFTPCARLLTRPEPRAAGPRAQARPPHLDSGGPGTWP